MTEWYNGNLISALLLDMIFMLYFWKCVVGHSPTFLSLMNLCIVITDVFDEPCWLYRACYRRLPREK